MEAPLDRAERCRRGRPDEILAHQRHGPARAAHLVGDVSANDCEPEVLLRSDLLEPGIERRALGVGESPVRLAERSLLERSLAALLLDDRELRELVMRERA